MSKKKKIIKRLRRRLKILDSAWKVLSASQCLMYNSLSPEKQEFHSRGIQRSVNYVKQIEAENEKLKTAWHTGDKQ